MDEIRKQYWFLGNSIRCSIGFLLIEVLNQMELPLPSKNSNDKSYWYIGNTNCSINRGFYQPNFETSFILGDHQLWNIETRRKIAVQRLMVRLFFTTILNLRGEDRGALGLSWKWEWNRWNL